MSRIACSLKYLACFGVLLMSCQLLLAAPVVYDSREDFSAGPSAPTGLWRYQYGGTADFTGPYTDLPYWSAGESAWELQAGHAPWLMIYAGGCHPESTDDAVLTFLAPAGGLYLVSSYIRATGGNGSVYYLTQGLSSGADSNMFSSTVLPGEFAKSVLRKVNLSGAASAAVSKDQLHFRVNCNGDLNSDGVVMRDTLCRIGTEQVQAAYTSTLATAFGTGKPEIAGVGEGQLGDKDSAGYPTWFYQMGAPGNSASFYLIPSWDGSIYTAGNGGSFGYCKVGDTWAHTGPTESASTIVTYCSPYKPTRATISCTAGTSGSSDGVLVRIYMNDTLLPGCTLDLPSTGSGTIGTNDMPMIAGDCLHVTISPKASQNNDSTALSVTVSAIPEPKRGTIIMIM